MKHKDGIDRSLYIPANANRMIDDILDCCRRMHEAELRNEKDLEAIWLVRAWGKELNELGGFEKMQKVAMVMDRSWPGMRIAGLLNNAWDGIGDWHK